MTEQHGQGVARGAPPPSPFPAGGVFGVSEVIPKIAQISAHVSHLRGEWIRLADEAAEAKSLASRTRANLIVELRIFGNSGTGAPIRASNERNEWADADEEVQRTALASDLATIAARNAREAYLEARSSFDMLRTALGMERDSWQAERGGR